MSRDNRTSRPPTGSIVTLASAFTLLLAAQSGLAEQPACQKTEGTSRVTCAGACPARVKIVVA